MFKRAVCKISTAPQRFFKMNEEMRSILERGVHQATGFGVGTVVGGTIFSTTSDKTPAIQDSPRIILCK